MSCHQVGNSRTKGETCDLCDAPTRKVNDQFRVDIDGKTYWVCHDCLLEYVGEVDAE